MSPLLTAIFSVTLLLACGPTNHDFSTAKVINGRLVANAPHSVQQWLKPVVELRTPKGGGCSGSFIGVDTLLTAAHCIHDEDNKSGHVRVQGIKSVRTVFKKLWQASSDIALVKFPEGTTRRLGITKFLKLARTPPKPGSKVVMAGYGKDYRDLDDEPYEQLRYSPRWTTDKGQAYDYRLRYGSNTVDAVSSTAIIVRGDDKKEYDGRNAVSYSGDSGGPLLDTNWEIVGTTIRGRWENRTTRREEYHNASSTTALETFRYGTDCSKRRDCLNSFFNDRSKLRPQVKVEEMPSGTRIGATLLNGYLFTMVDSGEIYRTDPVSGRSELVTTLADNFLPTALASDRNILYYATRRFVYASTNFGKTFEALIEFDFDRSDGIKSLAVSEGKLYVLTKKHLWRSMNRKSIVKVSTIEQTYQAMHVAAQGTLVYLALDNYVFHSKDSGLNFKAYNGRFGRNFPLGIGIAANELYLCTSRSVLKSTDHGRTFEEVWRWLDPKSFNINFVAEGDQLYLERQDRLYRAVLAETGRATSHIVGS